MSFCINCGVKLHSTAETCPLCNTPVLNPGEPVDTQTPRPYVRSGQLDKKKNNEFEAVILSIVLITVNLVCLVSNLLYSNVTLWFTIVLSSSCLIAVASLIPLLWTNFPSTVYILAISAACASIMVSVSFVVESFVWFFRLGLPLLILIDICLFLGLFLRKFIKPGILPQISLSLFVISVISIGCDMFIKYLLYDRFGLSWSLIVAICCISVSLIFYLITYNTRWRLFLQRYFHF